MCERVAAQTCCNCQMLCSLLPRLQPPQYARPPAGYEAPSEAAMARAVATPAAAPPAAAAAADAAPASPPPETVAAFTLDDSEAAPTPPKAQQ